MTPEFDMQAMRDAVDLVCDYADAAECRYGECEQEKNEAIALVRSNAPAALDEIERLRADVDSLASALAESEKIIIINSPIQAKRIAELESCLKLLQGHNYVNATPDGSYALRILQSYRAMCDVQWSDAIDAPPTNPLCIEMNKVNDAKRGNAFCYDLMGNCNQLRRRCWNLEDQNIQLRESLVEERAATIAYENNMQLCECRSSALCQARRQLRAEGLI